MRGAIGALAVAGCLAVVTPPLPVAAGDSTVGAGWVADTAGYTPPLPSALNSLGACTSVSWATGGLVSGGGVINSAGQGYPPTPLTVSMSGTGCETLIGGSGTGSLSLSGRFLSSTVSCSFGTVYERIGTVLQVDSAVPGSCVVDNYTTSPVFFSLRGVEVPIDGGGVLGGVGTVAIAGAWTILPTSGPI
jgi:hypothetical protein